MAQRFARTITLRLPTTHLRTADRLAAQRPRLQVGALHCGNFLTTTRSDILRLAIHIGLNRLQAEDLKRKSSPATKTR